MTLAYFKKGDKLPDIDIAEAFSEKSIFQVTAAITLSRRFKVEPDFAGECLGMTSVDGPRSEATTHNPCNRGLIKPSVAS